MKNSNNCIGDVKLQQANIARMVEEKDSLSEKGSLLALNRVSSSTSSNSMIIADDTGEVSFLFSFPWKVGSIVVRGKCLSYVRHILS